MSTRIPRMLSLKLEIIQNCFLLVSLLYQICKAKKGMLATTYYVDSRETVMFQLSFKNVKTNQDKFKND